MGMTDAGQNAALKILKRRLSGAPGQEISSVWAVPAGYENGARSAIILAHGAGNDMHSAFLSYVHEGLAHRGFLSVKFNFPYKERGGRTPDRAPVLEATWRAVAHAVRTDAQFAPLQLFLGGKSLGGRMASHIAAAGEACAGLVFLGYPLHPARQPEKLRAEHLARIACPMLFVEGTRDPLCDLAFLRRVLANISVQTTIHVIEGADHSFKLTKSMARDEKSVREEIVSVAADWMGQISPAA